MALLNCCCNFASQIQYEEMIQEAPPIILPQKFTRIHKIIKALAQLQVFFGLCCLALGSLSDFASGDADPVKVPFIVELCGLYLMITGFVGICGSASYRRGLLTAFLVMSLHIAVICVPAIIATSVKAMIDSNKNCYASCEQGICKVLCGLDANNVLKGSMVAIRSDMRIEIGLIVMALLELILSLVCAGLGGMGLCEQFGVVDRNVINQVHDITTMKRPLRRSPPVPTVSGEIQPADP